MQGMVAARNPLHNEIARVPQEESNELSQLGVVTCVQCSPNYESEGECAFKYHKTVAYGPLLPDVDINPAPYTVRTQAKVSVPKAPLGPPMQILDTWMVPGTFLQLVVG